MYAKTYEREKLKAASFLTIQVEWSLVQKKPTLFSLALQVNEFISSSRADRLYYLGYLQIKVRYVAILGNGTFFYHHRWTENRQLANSELPSHVNVFQLKPFVMFQEGNTSRIITAHVCLRNDAQKRRAGLVKHLFSACICILKVLDYAKTTKHVMCHFGRSWTFWC